MSNYISYSLFGDNPRYCKTAVKCSNDAKKIFKDWKIVFFVDESVPKKVLAELEKYSLLVRVDSTYGKNGTLWRYQAIYFEDAERVIFRDADSRLTKRDFAAVNAWINSKYEFHIMRDHPYHSYKIMAGMFGLVVNEKVKTLAKDLKSDNLSYEEDSMLLASTFYEQLKDTSLIHATFNRYETNAKYFPQKYSWKFLGEIETKRILTQIHRFIRLIAMIKIIFGD